MPGEVGTVDSGAPENGKGTRIRAEKDNLVWVAKPLVKRVPGSAYGVPTIASLETAISTMLAITD